MGFSFKWAVEVKLEQVRTQLTGPSGLDIALTTRTNASRAAIIEGGVDFDHFDSIFEGEAFYSLVRDPRRRPFTRVATIDTDVYEAANVVGGHFAALINAPTSIVQPTISITPNMQLMSINGGKGLSVYVDIQVTYEPGKVIVDPPDANIPGVTIPIGPYEYSIGRQASSRLQAEYHLICTDTPLDLPVFEPGTMGSLTDYAQYEDVPVPEPARVDIRIENTLAAFDGDQSIVSTKIKASEGAAERYFATAHGPDGPTPCIALPEHFGLKLKRDVQRP